LLCADADELLRLVEEMNHPAFGLLLDTAHMKVSASALGFDLMENAVQIAPFIHAIHHSDNDGQRDTNHPIGAGYWFLSEMPKYGSAVHILEVHDQSLEEIGYQRDLLSEAIKPYVAH